MNKKIIINETEFEIIENSRDCYNKEDVESKYTDYFYDYDYILGDISYGILRLKGFCDKGNPKYQSYNDFNKYQEYLKNECAYGCRYFILKKVKNI